MSDTTNRQASVFLQDGDVIQDGDVYVCANFTLETAYGSHGVKVVNGAIALRPIATPEQTDGLTIEQRVTALESRLNTQPAEQPSETCKWNHHDNCQMLENPHNQSLFSTCQQITYCPTCGLRIEVVE